MVDPGQQPDYEQDEILAFLKKRKGILDGVMYFRRQNLHWQMIWKIFWER